MIGQSTPPSTELAGVLVALDLQGITLRADGSTVRARPVEKLDADTTALIRQSKPQLLEHLALSELERHAVLLAAYESVLWAVGRGVQVMTADLRGWEIALARYEMLSLEAL